MAFAMRNSFSVVFLVLLCQLHALRGNPVGWFGQMQYNPQPFTGIQNFPAPGGSEAREKVEKPDSFKPPAMPSFYAPNMQLPYAYPNYYPGMFPQYQAPPPNFNLKDNIEEKNDKNDDDDDKEKNDDSKDNDDDDEKPPPITNFMPGLNYAPMYPYPNYYPAQQYMYPGAQQAPSPYYQASPYGNQQQQQQPLNDEPKIAPPPPPKIPELMSTLVQLSKNHQKYGSLNDQPTCSSCNKCSQCYKSALCSQCGFCQNKLCDMAAASLPVIPENLRPLWEQWNERTADMNSMEMSGLILAPPKTWAKKLSKKTEVTSKRSHIKHAHKKADKKTHKNNTKKHS